MSQYTTSGLRNTTRPIATRRCSANYAPLASKIVVAFVYGSVAKRKDTSASDIDLMVMSDYVTYADVFGALEPIGDRLGRLVNPTVYTTKDFTKRLKQGNAFLTRVVAQPKVWVIGNEDVLPA